jgi:hypothetical protein
MRATRALRAACAPTHYARSTGVYAALITRSRKRAARATPHGRGPVNTCAKFWLDRASRFAAYTIQTDGRTDERTDRNRFREIYY